MRYKLNEDGTTCVDPDTKWRPIDQHTPIGIRILLTHRPSGMMHIGVYRPSMIEAYCTHWRPLPTFKD